MITVLNQLKRAQERYLELEALLCRPETLERAELVRALMKEYSELSDLVALHRRLAQNERDMAAAEQMAADSSADAEWRAFAHAELSSLKAAREGMLSEAQRLLRFLDYIVPLQDKELPPTSLAREFLGGSSFKY